MTKAVARHTRQPADVRAGPAPAAADAPAPLIPTAGMPPAAAPAGSPGRAVPAPTDELLLDRIRAGDPAAGDELVGRYAGPLLRYLQRIAGPEAAEELHQQAWVSVLDNLDRFDPRAADAGPGGFKAWLFRIATNKANDLWRSRGRERAMKDRLRRVAEPAAPWAGHRAESHEDADRLARAVERLTESQRQILALRYYGDMKFVDIAALLGCPLNTALGRVHKALIKLRETMGE